MNLKQIALIALAALSIQTAAPRSSQALILAGLAGAGPVAAGVIAGLVAGGATATLLGGASSGVFVSIVVDPPGPRVEEGAVIGMAISLSVLFAGIVLLDHDDVQPFLFSEVTAAKAKEIGLSKRERKAFNGEIDEINAIHHSVIRASTTQSEDRSTININDVLVKKLWEKHCNALEKDSCSAFKKVTAFMARSFEAEVSK